MPNFKKKMEPGQSQMFNYENPHRKSVWAKATDFDGLGKQIKPISFKVLLKGEGEPSANFVSDQWGGTYRLTFEAENSDILHYENRYHDFSDDLKGRLENKWGVLRRYRDGKRWRWEFKPLE